MPFEALDLAIESTFFAIRVLVFFDCLELSVRLWSGGWIFAIKEMSHFAVEPWCTRLQSVYDGLFESAQQVVLLTGFDLICTRSHWATLTSNEAL